MYKVQRSIFCTPCSHVGKKDKGVSTVGCTVGFIFPPCRHVGGFIFPFAQKYDTVVQKWPPALHRPMFSGGVLREPEYTAFKVGGNINPNQEKHQ